MATIDGTPMMRLAKLRARLNRGHFMTAKERVLAFLGSGRAAGNPAQPYTCALKDLAPDRLINGIHSALLNRPADKPSLEHWSRALAEDSGRIAELIPLLLSSKEFAAKLPSFLDRYVDRSSQGFFNEHTQYGEIGKFLRLALGSHIEHPIVVDVGANGKDGSNSYDLMRHFGWRGILFEANPRLADRIRREFADLDYRLISTAVSNHSGTARLFLGEADGVSSMHRQSTASFGDVHEAIEVPVERLPTLLEREGVPKRLGLLSIDAEGEDLNILNDTIESGYRPQWIIFEAYMPEAISSLDSLPLAPAVMANYAMAGATYSNHFLKRVSDR